MSEYYGTYMRPDGTWAETINFNARTDLEYLLIYMAQDRPHIITTDLGELAREKKKIGNQVVSDDDSEERGSRETRASKNRIFSIREERVVQKRCKFI